MRRDVFRAPYSEYIGTVLADGQPSYIEVARDPQTQAVQTIQLVNTATGERQHPLRAGHVSNFEAANGDSETVAASTFLDYLTGSMYDAGPATPVSQHVQDAADMLGAIGMLPRIEGTDTRPRYIATDAIPVIAHMAIARHGNHTGQFVA